MMIGDPSSVR